MAVIPSAASNTTTSLIPATRTGKDISAGAGMCASEPFSAYPITIPVAALAASPPRNSSEAPNSPHVFDLPHYSPISSYEEERDILDDDDDDDEEEEEEEELAEAEEDLVEEGEEGGHKSDRHRVDGEASTDETGLEYLEIKEEEEDEEDETEDEEEEE